MTNYAGYVYLIGSARYGWYKIGKSKSAHIRIRDIGILLPFRIDVFAVWGTSNEALLEAEFHHVYKHHRLNGEWFLFKRPALSVVMEAATTYPSVRIFKIGELSKPFLPANLEYDKESGEKHEWKMQKCAAHGILVKNYLDSRGLAPTKENKKEAKKWVRANPRAFVSKVNSLQKERTV